MNADTKNLFTKAHQAGTVDNIRTTNCFQAPWVFQERKCGPDLFSLLMCRDGAYHTLRAESPSIFLDKSDLSRKIEGDSARRVCLLKLCSHSEVLNDSMRSSKDKNYRYSETRLFTDFRSSSAYEIKTAGYSDVLVDFREGTSRSI